MSESSSAVLSPDGLYRYELERWWGQGPAALWVMLNPSTADAERDDHTIRRCRTFTRAWGFAGLVVVNLFALRTTDPRHLLRHPDPVGPDNEQHLQRWLASKRIALAVAAWGAWKVPALPGMDRRLAELAAGEGVSLLCLGTTKGGDPRHPARLNGEPSLERWQPPTR